MKKWRDDLEAWIRNNPGDADALAWLGDAYVSDYLNRWNEAQYPNVGSSLLTEAENTAKASLKLNSNLPIAHYAMGMVLRAKNQYPQALIEFGKAVSLDPSWAYPRFLAQYANEFINNGQPANALPLITAAINRGGADTSFGVFYWIRGRAYFFTLDYQNAISDLETSIVNIGRDNLWYSWLYLISACVHNNDLNKAHTYLSGFDKKFPNFVAGTIDTYELSNPNPFLAAGLQRFHDGLRTVGRYP